MAEKKVSFEDKMKKLEDIVTKLESGNIPLDKALDEFKTGVKLSNQLQGKLSNAEHTLTKMMTQDGKEVPYDRDKNGQDTNDTVDNGNTDSSTKPSDDSDDQDPFR